MVAITVILAAVIAAFVFQMAGTTGPAHNVAVTAQQTNQTSITVMYAGTQSTTDLVNISVKIDDTAVATIGNATGIITVGSSKTYLSDTYSGRNHVVAVGTFTDGKQQVVLDTTV